MNLEALFLVLLGAFLSLFASIFLEPVLIDPARRLMVRMLGQRSFLKERQTVSGTWHMRDWRDRVPEDRFETETDDAELYQVGKHVWGRFTSRGRRYTLSGKIERDSVFTGTWSEPFEGIAWHGAFQFKIHYKARTMSGSWVGISKEGDRINRGEWEWKRPDERHYPSGATYGEERVDSEDSSESPVVP